MCRLDSTRRAAVMTGRVLQIFLLVVASSAAPSTVKFCRTNDPNLPLCLKDSINLVLRSCKDGSEELGLPPLDPFFVPLLELKLGAGNVSVDVLFRDVKFRGVDHAEVRSVKANVEDRKLEVTTKIPHLDIAGNFHMEGGLLSFPIYAEGQFAVNTTEVVAVLIMYYKTVGDHLAVESLSLDLIPASISYDFGECLDGDNKLGQAMNWFLNENSHEVFTKLKPRITDILHDVAASVIDGVLQHLPAAVLLKE